MASLRVSQLLKLSCEDPRSTPTTDCVVLSQGSEPAVAASRWRKAKMAEYMKQYMQRPEVKAERAKRARAQYRACQYRAAEKAEYMKQTATRGGGGSKTATHP